jgi:inosine-uridine nucleoside N-ribohydrolase
MTCRARVLDNADYATDFNFVFDPEAAHIVLTAPWKKITVVGNVTTSARMTKALADQIGASGTPTARYIAQYARIDQPLWDEMTVAVALDPTLVTKKFTARMDVDLMPGAGYGTAQMWKDELAPTAANRSSKWSRPSTSLALSPGLRHRPANDRKALAPTP